MTTMANSIDYLANHQDLIPIVARWYFDAWRKYTEDPSIIERIQTKLLGRLNTDKLDICFLYFQNDELIGTISLAEKDIPNNESFTPCLSNLFVIEKYRRQKIGENLVEYAKRQAKNFGFEKLYLYTTDKTVHFWYEKLGWKIIKEDVMNGFVIKIMEMKL
ncbi:N-acetyltransferase [Alphaproteobacteria bacterium]|nr:N-acetyltransferase [Alphaproteobacteria bacterium]